MKRRRRHVDVIEPEPVKLRDPSQAWPSGTVVSESTGQVVEPPPAKIEADPDWLDTLPCAPGGCSLFLVVVLVVLALTR